MRDDYLKYDEIPSFFDDVLTESTGYDDASHDITWYESYSTYMEDAENLLRNLTPAQFTAVVETAIQNGYKPESCYNESVLDGLKKVAGAANDTKNKVVNKLIVDPMNKRKEKKKEERKAIRASRRAEEEAFRYARGEANNDTDAPLTSFDESLYKIDLSRAQRDFKRGKQYRIMHPGVELTDDIVYHDQRYGFGHPSENGERNVRQARAVIAKAMKRIDNKEDISVIKKDVKDELEKGLFEILRNENLGKHPDGNYGKPRDILTSVNKFLDVYNRVVLDIPDYNILKEKM